MKEIQIHPAPQPGPPDWCTCTYCREMPEGEKVCCKENSEKCHSRMPVNIFFFIRLLLFCCMILFLTVLWLHQYLLCHHHVICCLYTAYHLMFKHVFTIEIKCDMGLTTNNSHKNNPRNQIQDRLPYSPQQAKTHISWQTVDGPSNKS
jgi:hypothetical protein